MKKWEGPTMPFDKDTAAAGGKNAAASVGVGKTRTQTATSN
jgi:hypothetical protein